MRQIQLYRYCLPIQTGVVLRKQTLTEREGLIVKLQQNEQIGWGKLHRSRLLVKNLSSKRNIKPKRG